jgi:hypothetical protein
MEATYHIADISAFDEKTAGQDLVYLSVFRRPTVSILALVYLLLKLTKLLHVVRMYTHVGG